MPKQKWRPDGCISLWVSSQQETRKPPQPNANGVSTYFRQFFLFPRSTTVLLNLNTIWRNNKKKHKSHQQCPIFALSNCTTFSQTQTSVVLVTIWSRTVAVFYICFYWPNFLNRATYRVLVKKTYFDDKTQVNIFYLESIPAKT
jgi:hypothetical protein